MQKSKQHVSTPLEKRQDKEASALWHDMLLKFSVSSVSDNRPLRMPTVASHKRAQRRETPHLCLKRKKMNVNSKQKKPTTWNIYIIIMKRLYFWWICILTNIWIAKTNFCFVLKWYISLPKVLYLCNEVYHIPIPILMTERKPTIPPVTCTSLYAKLQVGETTDATFIFTGNSTFNFN